MFRETDRVKKDVMTSLSRKSSIEQNELIYFSGTTLAKFIIVLKTLAMLSHLLSYGQYKFPGKMNDC